MIDWTTAAMIAIGLAILVAGAEVLVRSASRLASAVGVSPLVIGLTVVAYGTSSPELAVSVGAALAGQSDLAVGNVVGSNVFNVLFILGCSALVVPLVVHQQLVRVDVPIMIGVSLLLLLLGLDGRVSRADGILLLAGAIAYTVFAIRTSRRESAAIGAEYAEAFPPPPQSTQSWARNVGMILVGLLLLVLGSHLFVTGAVEFARALGISELVIGLTLVAAGTSLPELATSVMAALRGERDIAVGNVVGSNIFNILAVLGASAAVVPGGVIVAPAATSFDIPVMLAVAVACVPIFFSGLAIARWEGALFLLYYFAYTAYVCLEASGHAILPVYSGAMLMFVLPLTGITLAVVSGRAWWVERANGAPTATSTAAPTATKEAK